MSAFVDYYDLLEISPRATPETIERIFRYFAKRYHPDNQETGDERRFSDLVEAHIRSKILPLARSTMFYIGNI
ncbi:DnaJ domain-containing protein [Mesorhizobium sp. CA14]|uniref:DnaJ domain-containing protein n=1 Tax=Mesorhizobium sp. CA14 TaxID=2876642 RepID=UPI001CCD6DBA|nr:DnaJ domain-containing protein [Mesorhizobium sp. CA14]MBZ9847988.1 DnaJ domain-containing protein [Mesorhizobium sp. CA14]